MVGHFNLLVVGKTGNYLKDFILTRDRTQFNNTTHTCNMLELTV